MEKIICSICDSDKIKFFCKKNSYDLYICQNCEVGFVWPIPNNLDEIYKKEYFKNKDKATTFGYTDYDQDKEPMQGVFREYLDKFVKLTNGRKIFDIGAATGYFLDLAKRRGWQTAGIEISNYAAEEARTRGHQIVCGRLPDVKIKEKYDAVTMWDVLEHLDKPKAYLLAINKLLKEEGWLAINTIDKGSLWARIWGKRWHLIIPPEHLFYYSKKNLNLLLGQAGFKIRRVEKIGKKFSLAYIFKMLYSWQHFKLWNKFTNYFNKSFWRKLSIPINLRDNIFIIAQKVKDV